MSIGCYISSESLIDEFKEFRFTDRAISNALCRSDFSLNNLKMFVIMCQEGLEFYINKYFHKYLISFANSNILQGHLHLGISDYGEIIGIPVATELIQNNYEYIRLMIIKAFEKEMIFIDDLISSDEFNHIILEIKSKISIDIVPVDVTEIDTFGYNLTSYMKERQKEHYLYCIAEQKYREDHIKMMNKIKYYKKPINNMINDPFIRDDLKQYIKSATIKLISLYL